jgi:hypothetical protein
MTPSAPCIAPVCGSGISQSADRRISAACDRGGMVEALDLIRRATERDPHYGHALALAAICRADLQVPAGQMTPRRTAAYPTAEPMVCRLPAGGSRIRTFSPAPRKAAVPRRASQNSRSLDPEKRYQSRRRTASSNPVRSCAESVSAVTCGRCRPKARQTLRLSVDLGREKGCAGREAAPVGSPGTSLVRILGPPAGISGMGGPNIGSVLL